MLCCGLRRALDWSACCHCPKISFDALAFVHVRRSGKTTSLSNLEVLHTAIQWFCLGSLQIYQKKLSSNIVFSTEKLKGLVQRSNSRCGELLYSGLSCGTVQGLVGAPRTSLCGRSLTVVLQDEGSGIYVDNHQRLLPINPIHLEHILFLQFERGEHKTKIVYFASCPCFVPVMAVGLSQIQMRVICNAVASPVYSFPEFCDAAYASVKVMIMLSKAVRSIKMLPYEGLLIAPSRYLSLCRPR